MADWKEALEKMHTDASGVPGPDPDSGKIWLNTTSVVDGLVRQYVTDLLEQVGQTDELMRWIDHRALTMNNLFLGITPSDKYSRGPWNDQFQCGQFVANALLIDCDLRHAVRDALVVLAAKVLRVYKRSNGQFTSDQGAEINGLIGQVRDALLGTTDWNHQGERTRGT